VGALGGASNLSEVTACTTRLRLTLLDNHAIDEAALKRLGSRGLLRSGATGLQVVLGPIADQVAGEIRDAMRAGGELRAAGDMRAVDMRAGTANPATRLDASPNQDASAMLAALGGRKNVADVEIVAGRLSMRIADSKAVDERALSALGIRGVAHAAGLTQLLIAGSAEEWAQPLWLLLA
jgi:PTS system N-acetylglucosamine-specific IIC component